MNVESLLTDSRCILAVRHIVILDIMEIFLWAAFFCPRGKFLETGLGFFVVFNAGHVIIFLKTSASFIYLQKQRSS